MGENRPNGGRMIDRLDQFAKLKNLNDNRLTQECGISVGTLGKSRKPGKDITRRTAASVLDRYPELNSRWLITGEGEMFAADREADYPSYPLIEDFKAECGPVAGLSGMAKADFLPHLSVPGIPRDTEFFIQANGYSMIDPRRPEFSIPPGALVGLAKINAGILRWGETYAVVTNDGVMLKRLFPDESNPDLIRCLSYNTEEYPEFSIPVSEVKEFARLTCVIPIFVR